MQARAEGQADLTSIQKCNRAGTDEGLMACWHADGTLVSGVVGKICRTGGNPAPFE
jgi:hypothetical protein